MRERLAARFIRHAVIYALLGMAWGIYMAASHDHATHPGHAHLLLLGWVSMALYGIVYRLYPKAAEGRLPVIHFWLANLGVIAMAPGIALILTGNDAVGEPLAVLGSLLTIVGVVLFAVAVFRGTSAQASGH